MSSNAITRAAIAGLAFGVIVTGCVAPRPERVVLSRADVVPATLARRSREDLSDYYARTASVVDSGASITVLARIVDRSYVLAAERERARSGRWSPTKAARELQEAEQYYLSEHLSFEIEVGAMLDGGMSTRRFADIGSWQWTLAVDDGEPLVAVDATTTWRRLWREQGGGGYFQGRTFVPEPLYSIEHHDLRGVARFGPPAPMQQRVVTLRAFPPRNAVRARVAMESGAWCGARCVAPYAAQSAKVRTPLRSRLPVDNFMHLQSFVFQPMAMVGTEGA